MNYGKVEERSSSQSRSPNTARRAATSAILTDILSRSDRAPTSRTADARPGKSILNSLSCPDAQRGYRHAIDEFVDWYCSEPGLSFSKTVVVRHRMHLESRNLAPETINLRLGAVRRLAYQASDCSLLS